MYSENVNKIMFDFPYLSEVEIIDLCSNMPNKLLRWLGANHPDNRIRKLFFLKTGISIGSDTVINQNFIVSDNYENLLHIGNRVAISPNVTVICASGPNNSYLQYNQYVKEKLLTELKVIIEDDVWIGSNVVILPGVRIRENSIIGAGSVVTKSTDFTNSIYSGVPAIFKKKIE